MEPKTFKDSAGKTIRPGDILYRQFYARWRERPGYKRVAEGSLSGRDVIVSDEGGLKPPTSHWVTYIVEWDGACLIAKRHTWSDFQALTGAEHFDAKGRKISERAAFHYMNGCFNSRKYTIHKAEPTQ